MSTEPEVGQRIVFGWNARLSKPSSAYTRAANAGNGFSAQTTSNSVSRQKFYYFKNDGTGKRTISGEHSHQSLLNSRRQLFFNAAHGIGYKKQGIGRKRQDIGAKGQLVEFKKSLQ